MTKLFVDANIYLDFYRSASDRLFLFDELKKLGNNLIISEQGYKEFQRNRTAQLTNLMSDIKSTAMISIHTTAVVQDMVEHKEIRSLQSKIREIGQELNIKIEAMLDAKLGDDPVLDAYKVLTELCTFVPTTEEHILKARRRKLLGNPPTSPDRHSVGDELLWEELIHICNDDLIIVSKDKAFTENKQLLRDEFASTTSGKKLKIVKSVSEALKIFGMDSERLEATEAEIELTKNRQASKLADFIMETAIRKSSPIILNNDEESLILMIGNIRLGRKNPEVGDLLGAIKELIKMKLIKEVSNRVYELTEYGRTYESLYK